MFLAEYWAVRYVTRSFVQLTLKGVVLSFFLAKDHYSFVRLLVLEVLTSLGSTLWAVWFIWKFKVTI